jgi:hypothetical protein
VLKKDIEEANAELAELWKLSDDSVGDEVTAAADCGKGNRFLEDFHEADQIARKKWAASRT